MFSTRKGFTLLELIITVVIVGILVGIAVPNMTRSVDRARRSEAVAALGAIRVAERLYWSENNAFITVANNQWVAGGPLADWINQNDLNGRYFTFQCYTVALDAGGFTATCIAANSAIADGQGLGIITMDQDGGVAGL